MSKTMTKYQLDHFERKVRRQFDPLIDDAELLVKQFKTQATDKAVAKLSKKIGADKIINKFRQAEKMLEDARATALTFFEKKKPTEEELNYKFRNMRSSYRDDKLTLQDCEEQLRDWASNLAEKEVERRPEGARLKQLKELKEKAIDTVMESGTPDSLAIALDNVSKKIGLRWDTELNALPNFKKEN
jgi:DNA repair ATPase RecN|tara:strand:- start:917 stop:1477 length:561 start_codon:yes stop_codon:yes gene_type:complete